MTTKSNITAKSYGTLEKFLFLCSVLYFLVTLQILLYPERTSPVMQKFTAEEYHTFLLVWAFVSLSFAAVILVVVQRRANRNGEKYVLPLFIFDSVKLVWTFTYRIIRFMLWLFRVMDTRWEVRKTEYGKEVQVKYLGNGEYEDAGGAKYRMVKHKLQRIYDEY